jgi:hypothetical protein
MKTVENKPKGQSKKRKKHESDEKDSPNKGLSRAKLLKSVHARNLQHNKQADNANLTAPVIARQPEKWVHPAVTCQKGRKLSFFRSAEAMALVDGGKKLVVELKVSFDKKKKI